MKQLVSSVESQGALTSVLAFAAESTIKKAFRRSILLGSRADGRADGDLRPLQSSVDVLPRAHGSSYFQRGDTHVLCSTTLGSRKDCRWQRPLWGGEERKQMLFLHYDFPPYCTGETGIATSTNRRMVSLLAVLLLVYVA